MLDLSNVNIKAVVESIFRIRDNKGKILDYKVIPPHEKLLKTGLLGDRSKLNRIINKGRQGGFSFFFNIECLMIAQLYPNTNQYYVATKEEKAVEWLKKSEELVRISRLSPDGNRLIDMDFIKSSQLKKIIKHFPKGMKKDIERSHIIGLSASPSGIRGETGINIILDEFAQNMMKKDMQMKIYNAIKYFVSQGGQMSVSSTPLIKTDAFWEMYSDAENRLLSKFYFPIIENWEEIDLNKDLRLQQEKLVMPYFWTKVQVLEEARRQDVDYFKQEVLGIPADILLRYIPPELLYANVNSIERFMNDNNGYYIFGIDVGQKRDLTAITVGEIVGDEIYERWVQDSQDTYTIQAKDIIALCKRYKPVEIRIDNTGVGRGVADILESTPNMPPIIRIEFASYIEENNSKRKIPTYLMEEFKKSLVDRRYHLINNPLALNHVLRIEKDETIAGSIKFTGKKGGQRDDHAWSKALLNAPFDKIYKIMPVGIKEDKKLSIKKDTNFIPQKKEYAMW